MFVMLCPPVCWANVIYPISHEAALYLWRAQIQGVEGVQEERLGWSRGNVAQGEFISS
jgi:hypothetical protein